jgi:hypothetical protein
VSALSNKRESTFRGAISLLRSRQLDLGAVAAAVLDRTSGRSVGVPTLYPMRAEAHFRRGGAALVCLRAGHHRGKMMKYRAGLFGVMVLLSTFLFAETRASGERSYIPRLGDIMEVIQQRHFRLWYAGRVKNWPLAEYQLEQIKNSFQDAMTFYPGLPIADMTSMAGPAAQIRQAIKERSNQSFRNAFSELTAACNNCHRSNGFEFIEVIVPRSAQLR